MNSDINTPGNLTIEMIQNEPPVTIAGVFITRRCNLACSYCHVIDRKIKRELELEEWKRAFSILGKIGIEKVAILGGEPTVVQNLEMLIAHVSQHTNLDLVLISNSLANPQTLKHIVDAGLKRYSTSIDSILNINIDTDSWKKSNLALQTIKSIQKWGVEHITAYAVVNRINLEHLPELAKYLTEQRIWLYMIPFHWGNESFWENRATTKLSIALESSDLTRIKETADKLIEMKAQGYLISNSNSFLKDWEKYLINTNWHCGLTTSELRVDADGALMCCNDIRGDVAQKFSIFDLEIPGMMEQFQLARAKDSVGCPGCFWPSHYHAHSLRWKSSFPLQGAFPIS